MADLRTTLTILGRNQTRRALKEVKTDIGGLTRGLRDLKREALALAGVTIGFGGVADLARLADNYQLIGARLRSATGAGADFAATQEEIFRLAQSTNTSLESTSDLYARVARSTRELGISQEDALSLTQAVNQSLRLSGAGAAQASALVTQFGQALASGVLRGDEFNSVMENGDRLSRALADGLGVGIGQLRAMAEQGQLTADVVIKALLSQQQAIADEAADIPLTIGAAYTNLENALTRYVGQANQAAGVTATIASGIGALAESFDEVAEAAIVVGGLLVTVYGGRAVGAVTAYAAAQAKAAIDTRRLSIATLEGLRAKEADALAARAAAVANLNMARIMDQATGGMARQAVAARQVAAAHATYTAAATASATAARGLSVAAAAGRGALSLLGGPVGAITTALLVGVTAWSAYGNEAKAAAADLESFNDTADRLLGNLDAITRRQIEQAISLGETAVAAIESRIRVVSAALQSTRDEQRTVELRRELTELQEQEIDQGDKLVALRRRLAAVGSDKKGGTGVAQGLGEENSKLSALVKERDALVDSLKKIDDQLTAGPDPKERSNSFNILRLNTLRSQAGDALDRGNTEDALSKMQEARGIIAALAESGETSAGYLQTQIQLVTELAVKIKDEPLTPETDEQRAQASMEEYARLRDEFLKQNPGKSLIDVDLAGSRASLQQFIADLQAEANRNPITVPVQPATGAGQPIQENAAGGLLRGPGTGTSDSFLSWVSNGEFILRAAAVKRYGPSFLNALNSMRLPKYATGGLVARSVPGGASPASAGAPIYFDLNSRQYTATIANDQAQDLRLALRTELGKRGAK